LGITVTANLSQMIDLRATNKKLQQRSRNIIRVLCGPSSPETDEELDHILEACNGSVKLSVASILLQISPSEAAKRLEAAGGGLAKILNRNDNGTAQTADADNKSLNGFVLCVDGGGSKCAAVLLGPSGQMGSGEAGECNV
jgi:N-acetylmuramic acid 6-phosphate etherase